MKRIEIDDDLYAYIAAHTQHIGESASDILRRLLAVPAPVSETVPPEPPLAQGSVFDLLNQAEVSAQKGAVGRFLFILAMLYRCHPDAFQQVLDIRGRNRLYFAADADALQAAGNSTNPKQIPGSPYWVITNTNTTRKKSMLTAVARKLGYTEDEAEQIRDYLI